MTYPTHDRSPIEVAANRQLLLDDIKTLKEDRDKWMEEAGRLARLDLSRTWVEAQVTEQNNRDLRAKCREYREERDTWKTLAKSLAHRLEMERKYNLLDLLDAR